MWTTLLKAASYTVLCGILRQECASRRLSHRDVYMDSKVLTKCGGKRAMDYISSQEVPNAYSYELSASFTPLNLT